MLKQSRLVASDIATLKAAFEGNDELIQVIRKVFYPQLTEDSPIRANFDLWTKLDLNGMTTEQKVIRIEAHQLMVNHIENALGNIITLIGKKNETPEQVLERLHKDSTK